MIYPGVKRLEEGKTLGKNSVTSNILFARITEMMKEKIPVLF